MAQIRSLLGQLDTGDIPIELVTISFDPDRDTPEALQQYAAQIDPEINAAGSNWRFVTGPAERLKNVIGGGFGVYYQADEAGGFTFDPAIVMVDGNGIMRAIYERDLPDLQTIERDLMLVVTEVKNSEGPGKLVYEAAHLFLCYPPS
jgi:protein SCO1/2